MIGETKLVLPDPTTTDMFGQAVAIDGNVAVVGASGHDLPVTNIGAAFVYNVATGAKTFKVTPFGGASGDSFGTSVDVSGDVALIGAPSAGLGGAAYLYNVSTGNPLHGSATLTASDAAADDSFGCSVGIDGNRAVVGAYMRDDAGMSSGAAYVYDVGTGNQLYKLVAGDAAPADYFGYSVAVSGNVAIIGAYLAEGASPKSGAAYLFDLTTGLPLHGNGKLTAPDGAMADKFGFSVDIDGNVAIVGAYGDRDGGPLSGSAYLFDVTTGALLPNGKLTADDAQASDYFGYAVAIDGNTAAVGANWEDEAGSNAGAVYLFNVATGAQTAKLIPSDAAAADQFGCSVDVSGSGGIAGAYLSDVPTSDGGSAYLFATPEPATVALVLLGAAGTLVRRKRRA